MNNGNYSLGVLYFRRIIPFSLAFLFCNFIFSQQVQVKGIVFDKDSLTPMSYAYVVNRNSSKGVVADEGGNFSIAVHIGDTLHFSYLGYSVTKLFTAKLKDSVRNNSIIVKIYLKPRVNELPQVLVGAHTMSKEQRELYENRIGEYQRAINSAFSSPITALYYQFSKKGKEIQKLSELYQNELVQELKEKRLSAEVLRRVTGNENINVKDFLFHFPILDWYAQYASDYNLYYEVKQCYRQYQGMNLQKK